MSTDPNTTATMTREQALAWAAGELMRPPGDDEAQALAAADVAGLMLTAAEADSGELPEHVMQAVPLGEVVQLLAAALTVGGSVVRQVPDAAEFLRELIAGLRGDDSGDGSGNVSP